MIVTRGIYTDLLSHPCFECRGQIYYREENILVSRNLGDGGEYAHRVRFHPGCFDAWLLANTKFQLSEDEIIWPRRRRP